MSAIEALILGIVQGLTEFLPISSSGHLEIGKALFGLEAIGQESLFLTLVLHVGTALSTLIIFRKDIILLIKGIFSTTKNENHDFAIKIVISMVPAVLVGLFLEDQIAILFDQNLILVGSMLFLTGIVLFWAEKTRESKGTVSNRKALYIGIVQAIAILPGISRSGLTIAGALILGVDREKAARFSFLMVLPLILGSMAKSLVDFQGVPQQLDLFPLIIGFLASLISGIFACKWMISLVKKSQLIYFSFYCFVVGSFILLYGFF
jgi:undecaprenyl-diphosphatase